MRSYYLIVFAAGLLAVGNVVHATTRDVDRAGVRAVAQVAIASPGLDQAKTS